jgi:hypothetical protein
MKRYRVLSMSFDTRALFLDRENTLNGLREQFGSAGFSQKLENFKALGPKAISVFAFHNVFLEQARDAFVIGAYYPAATAACALGERILNHLVLRLRGHFTSTPEYKLVHAKESFDDWERAVSVLESWGVLLPKAAEDFRQLARIRHFVLHFNLATDLFDRDVGLGVRPSNGVRGDHRRSPISGGRQAAGRERFNGRRRRCPP